MEYKYVKELEDVNNIKEIEEKYKVQIPQTLKDIIIKNNGGRPIANIFLTNNKKEKMIKTLLSYNKEDKENVYIFTELFEKGYIPFAIAEFGDVICVNSINDHVELYNHETDKMESICENVSTFFDILKSDVIYDEQNNIYSILTNNIIFNLDAIPNFEEKKYIDKIIQEYNCQKHKIANFLLQSNNFKGFFKCNNISTEELINKLNIPTIRIINENYSTVSYCNQTLDTAHIISFEFTGVFEKMAYLNIDG